MKKLLVLFVMLLSVVSLKAQCDKIEIKKDDMTDKIMMSSPISSNEQMFVKGITNSDTVYFLRLVSKGETLNVDGKGVIVLFEDGTKWEKPEKEVGVKYSTYIHSWEYKVFITLTKEDLEIFSTKIISKYRLYIYDTDMKNGKKFKEWVNCILAL